MLNWIAFKDISELPEMRPILCYCPEWNDTGYQVAYWRSEKREFYYPDQPNDNFSEYVETAALFMEAD